MKHALILVPGLMCDATAWQPVLPALSELADCHVVDHGAADTLPLMAQQILDRAPARFALAGHSMGGRVALEVMRLAAERVTHLGLLDTGHLPMAAGEAGATERQQRMALVYLAQTRGVRAMAIAWVQGMLAPDRLQDTALINDILDMFERRSVDVFQRQVNALLKRPDASDVLRQVECPTLVLCGELDAWAPPSQHQAMADLIPHHPAVDVLAGCGHMVMQEQPDAVIACMRRWLTV